MRKSLFPDALKQLLEEFERSSVRELHIRTPDFELYLSTDPAAGRSAVALAPPRAPSGPQAATIVPAPSPAPTPRAPDPAGAAAALPEGAIIVSAPNLGTFYRAPKPGAANYVELGAKVSAGDELCLIEVMKLFTAVRAAEGGTVHSILVEDGAMVEGGQPLFALVRD
jgi:acetyl-CoA carboxylase biotin carboxyl carrier protein